MLWTASKVEKEPRSYDFYQSNMDGGPLSGTRCLLGWMSTQMPEQAIAAKHTARDYLRNVGVTGLEQTVGLHVNFFSEEVFGFGDHRFYALLDSLEGGLDWRRSGKLAASALRKFVTNYLPEGVTHVHSSSTATPNKSIAPHGFGFHQQLGRPYRQLAEVPRIEGARSRLEASPVSQFDWSDALRAHIRTQVQRGDAARSEQREVAVRETAVAHD